MRLPPLTELPTTMLAAKYSNMYITSPWMASESRMPRRMSFLGFLASAPSEVMDSKPTRSRMAIVP